MPRLMNSVNASIDEMIHISQIRLDVKFCCPGLNDFYPWPSGRRHACLSLEWSSPSLTSFLKSTECVMI